MHLVGGLSFAKVSSGCAKSQFLGARNFSLGAARCVPLPLEPRRLL